MSGRELAHLALPADRPPWTRTGNNVRASVVDGRVQPIVGGTTEIMKEIIGHSFTRATSAN